MGYKEFLVFLGNSTARNNVNVTGFNNIGLTIENDVYKMLIDMELKGNGADINKVLTDIDNLGVKYSIGSVSYRQNEPYDHLKRFFDDLTDLPWYEEPDEEEIEEYNKEKNPSDIPIEDDFTTDESYPEFDYGQGITPETPVPDYTEPTPTPTPEVPKSIDERLDQLLELMAFKYGDTGYEVRLLTNNKYDYKDGQDMRLAITLCLIMFDEPVLGNADLFETENSEYGVL